MTPQDYASKQETTTDLERAVKVIYYSHTTKKPQRKFKNSLTIRMKSAYVFTNKAKK